MDSQKSERLFAIKNNLNSVEKNPIHLRSTIRKSKIFADGRKVT